VIVDTSCAVDVDVVDECVVFFCNVLDAKTLRLLKITNNPFRYCIM